MNPRVKNVKPLPDYRLDLTFASGEVGVYDCRQLLEFGVFRELQNEAYFRQVAAINGTVAWPHEQDICPDTLYMDSVKKAVPEHRSRRGSTGKRQAGFKNAARRFGKGDSKGTGPFGRGLGAAPPHHGFRVAVARFLPALKRA